MSVVRRGRGPLLVLSAVALASSGCAIDLSHLRPGGDEPPPEEESVDAAPIAEAAVEELSQWPAVLVNGRMADGEDDPFDVEFAVTDTGTVQGSVDVGDSVAEVMEVDDRLFVSGDDTFWLEQASFFNVDSDSYPENWVRMKANHFGLDFRSVFAPGELSEILSAQVPAAGAADAVEEEVDGTDAYRLPLEGGDIWVSTAEPYEILRIQIAELAPLDDGDAALRTDITLERPDTPAIEEMYDTATTTAEDLGSARDSRIEVGWDGELDMECATGGVCTVSGTVDDVTVEDVSGETRVRMDASFVNDELGELTCNDSGGLEAGGSVDLSCSVDYELAASANPQSYEVSGEAELSTRSLSGGQVDETVESLEDQRESTLEKAEGGGEDSEDEDDGGEGEEDEEEES